MLILAFLVTLLTSHIIGLSQSALELSADYFKHRVVEDVCLFVCDEQWAHHFAKQASSKNIKLSAVNTQVLVNSSKATKCMRQIHASIGVILDPTCTNFEEIMYYASRNSLLDSMHKWLIIYEDSWLNVKDETRRFSKSKRTLPSIIRMVGELNISVDADITLSVKKDCKSYQLYEIFNHGKIQDGDLIINKAGTREERTGINSSLNEYKYYRRWDFRQSSMKMIIVVSPAPKVFDPKIITDRTPSPGIAFITKTAGTALEVISEIHNIRYIYSLADRWLDDYNQNNSKVVVASSLYYQQQDLSPILRFIREVHDKVDVLHPPLTAIETKYYYLIPTYGAGKLENQFLRPLSYCTWLAVVLVMAVCALMLHLTAKLERRSSAGQYAVFSVIASICQQFFEDRVETRTSSGARKVTILVTGIFCLLIYNYYTSSVVSWLLNGPPPSINSLQELLESPLELIFEDIGYSRSWIQIPSYYYNKRNAKIEDELRKKKVLNKNKNAPLLLSLEDGIKLVKSGGYAFHTEVDNANRLISRTFTQSELCEMGYLQSMEKTRLYSCVQKNSPYKEFLVWSLIRLTERGIVKCIQHRNAAPQVKCEGSSPRPLALGGAAPAFLLLAAGYLLATAIMFAERLFWKYRHDHSKNRSKIFTSKG